MSERTFYISVGGGENLPVSAIWPDKNAPENPTADDVAGQIRASGSLSDWLDEWNMASVLRVHVDSVEVQFP